MFNIDTISLISPDIFLTKEEFYNLHAELQTLRKNKTFNCITFSNYRFYISFNASNFLNGSRNNYTRFYSSDLAQIQTEIDNILTKIVPGVPSIGKWRLVRLDLAKYITLNQHFNDYISVIEQIKPYQNLIDTTIRKETFYFSSKNFSFKFENKIRQLKAIKVKEPFEVENVLQLEFSARKAKTIRKKLNVNIFSDLSNLEKLEKTYTKLITTYLFREKPLDKELLATYNDIKFLKMLKEQKKHNPLAILEAVKQPRIDYLQIRKTALIADIPTSQINKQIQELKQYRAYYQRNSNILKVEALHEEIYTKLTKL